MPTSPMTIVNEQLRRAVLLHDGAGRSDGELLGRMIDHRDEAALAALVQRHGPMVWGTCRRLLNHHDAEDAFQATFIVLVRKASSVVPREMVGNWLYGVAHRSALQAKRTAVRRRAREVQVTEMPDTAAVPQDHWPDLQPLLDEELSRLPDNYRAVIVLCDLEGRTRKEVAHQLGCPEGTVAGRLARARAMLAKRLAQRGVTLSGGVLAAVLAQNAASAVVPVAVVSNTIGAATLVVAGQVAATGVLSAEVATLTEGVLKAMLISKLKAMVAIVLVLGFLTTGASVLMYPTASAEGDKPTQVEERVKAAPGLKADVEVSTLTVTIKPKVNHVRINEPFDVDLRVVNSSKSTQSFQVMNCSWDEHWKSNHERVSCVGRDCTRNFPVTVKLEPGERYEKTLPMLLTAGKPEEKVPFKMGFTPIGSKETFWSNEVNVQVEPDGKLPPGVEEQLKWGEPVNGLRAAIAIRPIPGARKPGDLPDLFLVVQNVSKDPLRFSNATEVPEVGTLLMRGDGQIKWSGTFEWPTRVDVKLQSGEVAFQPLFPLDPKDGIRLGSGIADDVIKLPRYSLVVKMQVEKPPAGAWTGKLTTGETSGAAAEIKAKAPVPKLKEDKEIIQGTWYIERAMATGKSWPKVDSWNQIWVFKDDKLDINYADGSRLEMMYQLDPKQKLKAIDLSPTDKEYTIRGVYKLDADRLEVNYGGGGGRPEKFAPSLYGGRLFELRRAFTAWGKEVGGLQAGLGFATGGQRVYRHGETVKLVVRVRNVSNEVVKFEYVKQYLDEEEPTVKGADGKSIPQGSGLVEGRLHGAVEVSLNPGQEIQLESRLSGSSGRQYEFVPIGGKATTQKSRLFVGTGKVTLQYEPIFGNSTSSNMKLDPILSKLATGKLELEIKPAITEKK